MECSFVRNITCLFNVERFSIEDVHKTSAGSRETICLCTLRWILLPVLLKWEIAPVYHGSSFLSTSPSSLSTLLRADCRFLSLFENELGLWTGLQMCKWKYCKPKITMLLCVLLKLTKIKLLAVHTFCEAQGKGRARGRPRKVTQRSFIDGGWWMVVYLSLMLYTKFGCHHHHHPHTHPPTKSL